MNAQPSPPDWHDELLVERQLFDALFAAPEDPHPALRAAGLAGCRHAVASAVLRDPRTAPPPFPPSGEPMWDMLGRWLITLDGQRHRAMRKRFDWGLTARRVAAHRGEIERTAHSLLDRIVTRGTADLVTEFARPLPFSIITELMGIPPADRAELGERMLALGRGFANQRQPDAIRTASAAVTELLDYFDRLLAERARRPREDLLSELAADAPNDDEGRADLLANCVFFIEAGHATTTSLIAAGALILLQHPAETERLRAEPDRLPAAVDELLRLVTPSTQVRVQADEHLEIAGMTLPSGVPRSVFLAAANRDPAVFADPDEFHPDRAENPHLAFSLGRHFCLGAPLARLQGEIAIGALLARLPGLRLAGDPVWRGSIPLRELEHLPVVWDVG